MGVEWMLNEYSILLLLPSILIFRCGNFFISSLAFLQILILLYEVVLSIPNVSKYKQ